MSELNEEALLNELKRLQESNSALKRACAEQEAKTEAAEEKVHEIEKELIKRSEKEDALNFNIQRLTKRVETLQEELNKKSSSSGGFFSGSNSKALKRMQDELDAAGAALEEKVKENSLLQGQLAEVQDSLEKLGQEADQRIHELESVVEEIAAQLQLKEDEVAQREAREEEANVKITELEASVESLTAELKELKAQSENEKKELTDEITKLQVILSEKVPFDDTEQECLNALTLPNTKPQHKQKRREALHSFCVSAKNVQLAVTSYIKGILNRLNADRSVKVEAKKLTDELIKILVCIEESSAQIYTTFSSLLNEQSDETNIANLTQMINDYVMLQSKAQQKINERNKVVRPLFIDKKQMQLEQDIVEKRKVVYDHLISFITDIELIKSGSTMFPYLSNFISSIMDFKVAHENLNAHLSGKSYPLNAQQDAEAEIAIASQLIRTALDSVKDSLIKFEKNEKEDESERDAITENPIYSQMHRNTISFLNIMSGLSWKEVDYLQAIKNENIIAEMKEREGTLNTTICNLEKDVFKSKQEYDKLTAKLEELQEQLTLKKEPIILTDDANIKTPFPPNNKVETNHQFSNEQQSNQIFNEQLIKSLKSQVNKAETTCLEHFGKMLQLSSIIQKMQESLEKTRNESSERQKAIKALEDDMELSRKNYSAQMEVLSEHSISLKMNIERLDSLLEYIKSCEVQCHKCKEWTTIGVLVSGVSTSQSGITVDKSSCGECKKGSHTLASFRLPSKK